jgi:hypothetical protein
MLDGIYSITFRGRADWGMGMIILQHGSITGADAMGALYDGSYIDSGANLEIRFTMTVPPGVALVQGTPAQPKAYSISTEATVPKTAFAEGHPVLLQLPPGPVNVIFRRLRQLSP